MISILICGYNLEYELAIKKNISETIGSHYEIIYFRNTSQKGISEVYNKLKSKAKGEIICFVHEDVEFLTDNWGFKIKKIFSETPNIGLLGIAGGKYVSKNLIPILEVKNLIQGHKFSNSGDLKLEKFNSNLEEVINLDGVLLFTTNEISQKIDFDEKLLTGFHGYDIDYCLQVSELHKNYFTSEILIKHYSEGKLNQEWENAINKVKHKWKDKLPKFTSQLSRNEKMTYEYRIYWAGISSLGGIIYIIQNFKPCFVLTYLKKKMPKFLFN